MNIDYRKYGQTYYIRLDRGDEVLSSILEICKKEKIESAIYSGIGGCSEAEVQTFIPEKGAFETETIKGTLELVTLNGNVIKDENDQYYQHSHALFSFKEGDEHRIVAGHMKSITILYTAEIELRPVIGGEIKREYSPETGTGFWKF